MTFKPHHEPPYQRITAEIHPFTFPNLLRWRYLIVLLIKRDISLHYQQTVFGPLWYLAQPLASTTVLSIVFGKIAKMPTDSIHPVLFYLLGTILWSFFSDCFIRISRSLAANFREFEGASFPRLVVPLAAIGSASVQFLLQFLLFIICYVVLWHGRLQCTGALLLTIPAIVQLLLFGLGGGLLVAACTAKYRDLWHLVGFGMQLFFFCTPLIYPVSMVPAAWRMLYSCNPLVSVFEAFRYAFFGVTTLGANAYLAGWLVSVALAASGLIIFNCIEKKFIDTV